MTLTPFSRSHDGLDGWKMACLHPISGMNGRIFTKHVHLYCWDMEKNWLDFGDLDPIFKVTGGLRLLENTPVCTLSPEWMNEWNLTKLIHLYCCDMEMNWLDFGDLKPIFKVTWWLRLLENGLSAPCLMKEWMDFDQHCTTILLWHEKELIRFWWPWLQF